MEQSETKKPLKYVALITYAIALVCLLLGLFVPLFDGKNILALQLPDVFNYVAGKQIFKFGKTFTLSCPIFFLGMNKSVDIMAWTTFAYFLVTVLAVFALIPVIIGTVKRMKMASVFAYSIECAAVLVVSLYVALGLQLVPESKFCYNFIIPLGGSLIALIVLNCANKKFSGALKTVLLLLSCIAFLMLFNFVTANAKIGDFLIKVANKTKTSPMFFADSSGIDFLSLLFASPKGELKLAFDTMPDAKNKAVLVLSIITATTVLLNFFTDVIGLSTNAKRVGYSFNVARYLLELLSVVCLFVTVAVCKYKIGIMLIVISVAVFVQLAISVALLIRDLLKNRKSAEDEQPDVANYFTVPPRPVTADAQQADTEPALAPATEPVAEQPVRNEYILNPYVNSPPPTTEYSQTNPYRIKTELDGTAEKYEQPQSYKPAQAPAPQPAPRTDSPRYTSSVSYEPAKEFNFPAPQPEKPSYYTPQESLPESPVIEQTRVYKVNTLYQGPTDEFMKKLTNDDKVEFSMAFIERSKGEIGNVPDYVIGGDNRKFFSAVFIYLGRIRGIVSDNLLNKMYKELNML